MFNADLTEIASHTFWCQTRSNTTVPSLLSAAIRVIRG